MGCFSSWRGWRFSLLGTSPNYSNYGLFSSDPWTLGPGFIEKLRVTDSEHSQSPSPIIVSSWQVLDHRTEKILHPTSYRQNLSFNPIVQHSFLLETSATHLVRGLLVQLNSNQKKEPVSYLYRSVLLVCFPGMIARLGH